MQNPINQAVEILRSGGIVLFPSDTGWCIGVDATSEDAVNRLMKTGSLTNSYEMAVLVDTDTRIQSYVEEVPELAWDLIEYAEKPLTIVYSGAKNIAKSALLNDNYVAIRVCNDSFSKKLCSHFRKPIFSIQIEKEASKELFENVFKEVPCYAVNLELNSKLKIAAPSIIKLGKGNLIEIIRE